MQEQGSAWNEERTTREGEKQGVSVPWSDGQPERDEIQSHQDRGG